MSLLAEAGGSVYLAAMVRSILSTALKVAFACLLVGLILSVFGIDPWQLYGRVGGLADDAAGAVAGFIGWAWRYVVIGAVIVVPLWLAIFLVRGGWRR